MNNELCAHGALIHEKCERCSTAWQAWKDGYDFGRQQWWPADTDPTCSGTFVIRDKAGNMEVAAWVCDWNGKNGSWSADLRDVNRDEIVAFTRLPHWHDAT